MVSRLLKVNRREMHAVSVAVVISRRVRCREVTVCQGKDISHKQSHLQCGVSQQ